MAVVCAHAAGAVISAATLGFVLGTLGLLSPFGHTTPMVRVLAGSFVFLCALRDAAVWQWPLLSLRRQTFAWLPRLLGWRWGAFAWGLDLGQGWTTQITYAGYYAVALWSLVYADPVRGALAFGAYGLGRALPLAAVGLVEGGNKHDGRSLLDVRVISMVASRYTMATVLAFIAGFLAMRA